MRLCTGAGPTSFANAGQVTRNPATTFACPFAPTASDAVVTVHDTGLGISARLLPFIFDHDTCRRIGRSIMRRAAWASG